MTYINKIIWKYCFVGKGYENTWQSLSVILRGTTKMYNIKSAEKKSNMSFCFVLVFCEFDLWLTEVKEG